MSKSRIPWIAILFLVVLRISIGWQFLYEGLWKYDTLDSPAPWSAEGYLKASQGPFRRVFLSMTGDAYDQNWLNFEAVSQDWFTWRDSFEAHYQLDDKQKQALNRLLDGVDTPNQNPTNMPERKFSRALAALPAGLDLQDRASGGIFSFADGQLTVSQPVLPSEEAALKAQAASNTAFGQVVEQLARDSRALSFRQRLAAMLKGDPDRVGVVGRLNEKGSFDPMMGTVTKADENAAHTNINYGKVQEYNDLIMEYESGQNAAEVEFQHDHLSMLHRKLQMLKSELIGPVRALDTELKTDALKILTGEQLALGSVPPANTPVHKASMQAMWALLILGVLLMTGCCTRLAAVAAAAMLTTFYLVVPPWPGVPQPPSPEHALFINKNMIEVIALLVIASLPTGTWFGIDGLIGRMFRSEEPFDDDE